MACGFLDLKIIPSPFSHFPNFTPKNLLIYGIYFGYQNGADLKD